MGMRELMALFRRARDVDTGLLPDGTYDVVVREVKFEGWGAVHYCAVAFEVTSGPCKSRVVRERWPTASGAANDFFLASCLRWACGGRPFDAVLEVAETGRSCRLLAHLDDEASP